MKPFEEEFPSLYKLNPDALMYSITLIEVATIDKQRLKEAMLRTMKKYGAYSDVVAILKTLKKELELE